MNPVSNTAFYCCGIRMEDARRKNPVCNDIFAERFMDERGMLIFEPFKFEKMPNISNISRCRIIDDYVRAELSVNDKLTIITIGSGFDSRPYRLKGGNWLELDEPRIINYKSDRLPVEECPNPLRRIAVDFARESLAEILESERSDDHTVFVIEGVFMYLEAQAIENTIKAMQWHFGKHVLYCDLMTRKFFTRFAQSIHQKLADSGGRFSERPEFPEAAFTRHDYHPVECIPMLQRARELGILWSQARIPKFASWLMLKLFLKDLNGYAVHRLYYEQKP